MDSLRKSALVAGGLYLVTFASIPTLALYVPVRDRSYILGPGPDTAVIVGGILEMIVAFACIGTAVVLYPVIKGQRRRPDGQVNIRTAPTDQSTASSQNPRPKVLVI